MKGLIIFSKKEDQLTDKDYSIERLLEAARTKDVDLEVVTPEQFELVVTRKDKKSVLVDDKLIPLPDFIIPRMGSGTTYYAFSIIRQLECLGVYVCNDADAIYRVKDKLYMHQILSRSSLSTPNTMLAKCPIDVAVVKREIGFPLVIKNVTGSQGAGIYLCESEDDFIDIMELIYSNNNKANIILQEFVQSSYGQDLRVFVLGEEVIGCMRRVSKGGFKANFSKGASVEAFKLTPDVKHLATETAKLLSLEIAGIDLLFDVDGFKICEANSSPGFYGLEHVVGNNIAERILDYVLAKVRVSTHELRVV